MPLLIVLGLLAGYGSYRFVNFCKTEAKPKSNSQLENMTNEMIGKSKSECRKILRKYRQKELYEFTAFDIDVACIGWVCHSKGNTAKESTY